MEPNPHVTPTLRYGLQTAYAAVVVPDCSTSEPLMETCNDQNQTRLPRYISNRRKAGSARSRHVRPALASGAHV